MSAMDEDVAAELGRLRHSIDNMDAALVHLLAERFAITQQVGVLKATHGLPPADPAREAQQIARLRALAVDARLDPEFAEKFLGFIVAEVVRHHEAVLRDVAVSGSTRERRLVTSTVLDPPVDPPVDEAGRGRGRGRWSAVLAVVAVVAFASRLVPVLRGSGLWGLTGYDGGVYYAAAAGLAHGRLPYVDFLLLHPPGILLALVPFGLLGRVIGDPDAQAAARLVWMGLGTLSALLVALTLRRRGPAVALVGGLLYGVWVPALYVERTTALEALTGVLTMGAVLLLTRPAAQALGPRGAVVAGLLLGAATATKIWGVAPLVVLAVWCASAYGVRRAVQLLVGAAVAAFVICLPFFVRSPVLMWDMVVGAQLGRRRVPVDWYTKAVDTAGLTNVQGAKTELLVVVTLAVLVAVALSWRSRVGQVATLLLVVGLALLAASPAWAVDYASLVAAPIALLAGTATGVARRWWAGRRAGSFVPVAAVLALVVGYAVASAPETTFGERFPGRSLAAVVADRPGCVTSDDPAALVAADVIGRNIERGCPLVVDLGGYSYYLQPGASARTSRPDNAQWQRFVLDYSGSGTANVVVRFEDGGTTRATRRTIESWPVIGHAGRYPVRQPPR